MHSDNNITATTLDSLLHDTWLLLLGYAGKYPPEDNPQRLSVLRQLATRLPAVPGPENYHAIVVSPGGNETPWWHSPQVILPTQLLLTAGLWAGLSQFLQAQ